MNSIPREMLCQAVARYGPDLCDEPQRCEAILNDLCHGHREEIGLLVAVAKEGLASDLRVSSSGVPHDLLLGKHAKNLQRFYYTEAAAKWGVESWALALGIISQTDLSPTPTAFPEKNSSSVTAFLHNEAGAAPAAEGSPTDQSVIKPQSISPRYIAFGVIAALLVAVAFITVLVLKAGAERRATQALAAKEATESRARDLQTAKEKSEQEAKSIVQERTTALEVAEGERRRLEQLMPSVTIESLNVDVGYNVITLRARFEANNLQSVQCIAEAHLFDAEGNELTNSNNKPITTSRSFTPVIAQTYEDMTMMIYPRDVGLDDGSYTFKVLFKRLNGDIIGEHDSDLFSYACSCSQ